MAKNDKKRFKAFQLWFCGEIWNRRCRNKYNNFIFPPSRLTIGSSSYSVSTLLTKPCTFELRMLYYNTLHIKKNMFQCTQFGWLRDSIKMLAWLIAPRLGPGFVSASCRFCLSYVSATPRLRLGRVQSVTTEYTISKVFYFIVMVFRINFRANKSQTTNSFANSDIIYDS